MTRTLIKGGLLVTPTEERLTELLLEDGEIKQLGAPADLSAVREIDASGSYVTPGLLDLQVNGGPECDFWAELSTDKLRAFSEQLLSAGVTSILPTLITGDIGRLQKNRDFLRADLGVDKDGTLVRMPGLHFEGPFLSPQKPGVHPPEHLLALTIENLKKIIDKSCSLITIAPELDPEGKCISYLKEMNVVCSLGHSNATFDEARRAFAQGVQVITHTFNALPPLHHRTPGAVGAALIDSKIDCCVIPDGLHLAPSMVELVYRLKGVEKTILVSDIAAIGTSQGGLVGSSLVLDQGVRNMVNWGICTFAEAIRMASYNPARLLKLEKSIGSIHPGAHADLVIWDRTSLEIKQVIFKGKVLDRSARKTLSAC